MNNLATDTRKANCFNKFERGRCKNPRDMKTTRAQCCCSKGEAWGDGHCEVCPRQDEGNSTPILLDLKCLNLCNFFLQFFMSQIIIII